MLFAIIASGFNNSSNGVPSARTPWLTAAANPVAIEFAISRDAVPLHLGASAVLGGVIHHDHFGARGDGRVETWADFLGRVVGHDDDPDVRACVSIRPT